MRRIGWIRERRVWEAVLAIVVSVVMGGLFVLRVSRMRGSLDPWTWKATPCVIAESSVEALENGMYRLCVTYGYSHGGMQYVSKRYSEERENYEFESIAERLPLLRRYESGQELVCYVNPKRPRNAILVRTGTGVFVELVVMGIVFVAFVLYPLAEGITRLRHLHHAPKKRGDLWTQVVRVVKEGGEFLGGLFFVGIGSFVLCGVNRAALEYRGSAHWPCVEATVLRSKVVHRGDGSYHPYVAYAYEVDGVPYEADTVDGVTEKWEAEECNRIVQDHPEGATVKVRVHPKHAERVVLQSGSPKESLVVRLLPVVFVLVGVGIVIHSIRRLSRPMRRIPSVKVLSGKPFRRNHDELVQAFVAPIVLFVFSAYVGRVCVHAARTSHMTLFREWGNVVFLGVFFLFFGVVGMYFGARAVRMLRDEIRTPHIRIWPRTGALLSREGLMVSYELKQNPVRVTMFSIRLVCRCKDDAPGQRNQDFMPFHEQRMCRVDHPGAFTQGSFVAKPKCVPPEDERDWIVRWEFVVSGHTTTGRKWEDRYKI